MRIISKFQDYYDSALAYGHDKHVVYVRHLEEPEAFPEEFDFMKVTEFYGGKLISKKKKREHIVTPFTVAFCGKVYRGIAAVFDDGPWGVTHCVQNYFYDEASLHEYTMKYGLQLKVTKKEPKYMRRWGHYRGTNVMTVLTHEDAVRHYFSEPVSEQHLDFFAARKLPIAVCTRLNQEFGRAYAVKKFNLHLNPPLKDIQFFKVSPAYLAFQELEMFLGGIAAGEDNPMVGIDDCDLARAKGFDCYSFKKEPTKNKRKPCK